jgi:predicted peptidase
VNRKEYPAYVLFPQCPENYYWAYLERPSVFYSKKMLADFPIFPVMVVLKQLIDRYLLLPQIDKKRVYIIGISMGAMGVYDITVRYPEIFAAAIPICGIVNPKRLEAAKGVKFRLFHGSADNIVPPSGSRRAYKALKKAGAEVQYNEFPGVGHESWKQAFELPDFMKWLFFQKKE